MSREISLLLKAEVNPQLPQIMDAMRAQISEAFLLPPWAMREASEENYYRRARLATAFLQHHIDQLIRFQCERITLQPIPPQLLGPSS